MQNENNTNNHPIVILVSLAILYSHDIEIPEDTYTYVNILCHNINDVKETEYKIHDYIKYTIDNSNGIYILPETKYIKSKLIENNINFTTIKTPAASYIHWLKLNDIDYKDNDFLSCADDFHSELVWVIDEIRDLNRYPNESWRKIEYEDAKYMTMETLFKIIDEIYNAIFMYHARFGEYSNLGIDLQKKLCINLNGMTVRDAQKYLTELLATGVGDNKILSGGQQEIFIE